jgi:hypothetical protein
MLSQGGIHSHLHQAIIFKFRTKVQNDF